MVNEFLENILKASVFEWTEWVSGCRDGRYEEARELKLANCEFSRAQSKK